MTGGLILLILHTERARGERERERPRQRHTERQTQRETVTERQRSRARKRDRDIQTERGKDRWKERQTQRERSWRPITEGTEHRKEGSWIWFGVPFHRLSAPLNPAQPLPRQQPLGNGGMEERRGRGRHYNL